MSTNDVGSLLKDVIANNRKGNKILIGAFRTAQARAASGVGAQVGKALESNVAARLNPAVRKNLAAASKSVASLWEKRTGKISDGAEKAVDAVFDRTTSTIKAIAERIDAVDDKNKYAARYFELIGKAALPGIRVAHGASQAFVDGAGKLSRQGGNRAAAVRKARPSRKTAAPRKRRKSA